MRQRIQKLLSIMLAAMIMLPGTGTARAAESGTGTGYGGSLILNATPNEASGDLIPVEDTAFSGIKDPQVSDGVTTWDCIWFGNYWQGDTNGDGRCYAEETTVDGITYSADDKQPIKWRVLNVDADGNALLLSDKLVDIVQYNETGKDVTWETCTMRSYLNGYTASQNICSKDFSEKSGNMSFIYSAFSEPERNKIIVSELTNPDNPVYGTEGGRDTQDKIFCLSLDEARNPDYGFTNNEFTQPDGDHTDDDPARVAVITKFTDDKPGYYDNTAGTSAMWWLRSPGNGLINASVVYNAGRANASISNIHDHDKCVRPAFRMNLSSSSSLWTYAGTVSSDDVAVIWVSLQKTSKVVVGKTIILDPKIIPSNATDQTVTWKSSAEGVASVSDGVVTGITEGTAVITVTTNDGGFTATCRVTVEPAEPWSDPRIKKPFKEKRDGKDVTTWDCIWFGNYWQEDTNGDGYCYAEDTYDHLADSKLPVKWRVLDIDESGNALLLADKLIDIVQYNETYTDVTWETCTMRSYLNGYTASQNICSKDFAGDKSFLYNAFSETERDKIKSSELTNPDNPVFGTEGGKDTQDKIFCLSLDEVTTAGYGFIKNELTNPTSSEEPYYTDDDPARVAVTTKFTDDKPGYSGNAAGTSSWWWLRSPGYGSKIVSGVSRFGATYAGNYDVSSDSICVRPAFRMNLSSSSSLWTYAGTVDSKGTEKEPVAVTGVSLAETEKVTVGETLTLIPEISPADATDQSVTWKSSAPGVATVSANGLVTGIKEGTADITVTTHDGGFTATCTVTVEPASPDPAVEIRKPVTNAEDVTTWDCIWFGNYWQEDTNKDGKCYAEDTTEGGTTYPADDRQPIKWRVLDIDSSGNALLLADKLIDIARYNETSTPVTWETCTIRTYLNGYDVSKKNKSFLYNAFSEKERDTIIESVLANPDNPVYETSGGNATQDRIFCLSDEEARNKDYGFIKNEFTAESLTDSDPTRVAVTTLYTDDKPGYYGDTAGAETWWWLRTPGYDGRKASCVNNEGAVNVYYENVSVDQVCIRPALRLNLKSSSAFWDFAGTVSSEGKVTDPVYVTGVTLPATGSVKVGRTVTLTPVISPADATDRTVTWKSSTPGVATVSANGLVTGIKEGTADITVTTHDGGFTATCRVTVEPASPGPGPGPAPGPDPSEEDLDKDIDPDPEDLELDMLPGEIRRLNINKTGKYVYGVSYVSSDPKTVSVKNGVVTAKNLKKGETEKMVKVTATYNGESADFTITVRAGTPSITPGEKGSKISAAKTVKADVGTSKTVTAAVKLPKALQGKEVRAKVVLPEDLPGTSVADGDTENDIFNLGEGKPDAKGTKVSFVITPREAGAAYIVWTVTDDSGKESQAYTKVLIKNPLSTLSVNRPEDVIELGVGGGERLTVITEKGNTGSKDLSFSVKMKKGKGVKVSKSGFVTAASPDAEAEVTVKSGKFKKTVTVKVKPYSGSVLALSKTSVSAKRPKTGGKPKTVSLKISAPKKNPPAVNWSITGPPEDKDPEGITVKDGKVTVSAGASPGCYTVTAAPEGSSGYNPAYCEVIVK